MAGSTIPGHQNVADAVTHSGTQGAMTITSTAQPVRVGATNAERKVVTVYNNSTTAIYWGWDSTVTSTTGTPIEGKDLMVFNVNKNIDVYLVAASGSINVRITEAL